MPGEGASNGHPAAPAFRRKRARGGQVQRDRVGRGASVRRATRPAPARVGNQQLPMATAALGLVPVHRAAPNGDVRDEDRRGSAGAGSHDARTPYATAHHAPNESRDNASNTATARNSVRASPVSSPSSSRSLTVIGARMRIAPPHAAVQAEEGPKAGHVGGIRSLQGDQAGFRASSGRARWSRARAPSAASPPRTAAPSRPPRAARRSARRRASRPASVSLRCGRRAMDGLLRSGPARRGTDEARPRPQGAKLPEGAARADCRVAIRSDRPPAWVCVFHASPNRRVPVSPCQPSPRLARSWSLNRAAPIARSGSACDPCEIDDRASGSCS